MDARERTLRSEHGAIFVQVGISLFVLMAFNVFVLDYGMMWIGRRQAQNAADAGALAGAVARGYDDFDDPPSSTGLAHGFAEEVAEANRVWQKAGTPLASRAVVSFDCPTGVTGRCVRVDVYRDGENGSTAFPTLFGPVLGITTQKVRASATAIVGNGNATDCLRPIALPDNWEELRSPNGQFNSYDVTGNPLSGDRDSFTAPSASVPGRTTISDDFGVLITYDVDMPTLSPTTPITPGLIVGLTLPGAGTFAEKLALCSGQMVQLGQTLPVQIPAVGATEDGFDEIWSRDPYPPLTWDNGQSVFNSCAPECAPISPRMIPIALFDPRRFQLGRALSPPDWTHADVGCPTNSPCITVTNIVGFFVHCVNARPCDGNVTPHGHFLKYPGMTAPGAPTFVDDASWLVTTHLIR